MTVPKSQRGENKMEVWLAACDLARHTMQVTAGKSFETYRPLADELDRTSIAIAADLWEANQKSMRQGSDPREGADRLLVQAGAIAKCRRMLFLIDFAGKVTHRAARKTACWAEKARKVLNLARKWRESDARRLESRG